MAGIRPMHNVPAWVRDRSISGDVMVSDLGVFTASDHCRIAHARQLARSTVGVAAAAILRAHDPCAGVFEDHMPAACSPDFMGAALHESLAKSDAWLSYAQAAMSTALAHAPPGLLTGSSKGHHATAEQDRRPLGNAAIRAGIRCASLVQRGVGLGSQPDGHLLFSGRLRKRRRAATTSRNTVARGLLLTDSLCAPYTAAVSSVVHPIMSLRSSHLLHDHCFSYGAAASRDMCPLCDARVYDLPIDFYADHPVEHRWRHIEHLLTACPCVTLHAGLLAFQCLRIDLLRATGADPHALAVVERAFPYGGTCCDVATVCTIPFLLDPVLALDGVASVRVRCLCGSLVAAFLLASSICVATCLGCLPSSPALRGPGACGIRLPDWSSLRSWLTYLPPPVPADVFPLPCSDLLDVVDASVLPAPTSRGSVADARLGLA